jgi:hypothetical protein
VSAELVREALDSARSSGISEQRALSGSRRLHSPERVAAIISTFIRELPEDMTVLELRGLLEDL